MTMRFRSVLCGACPCRRAKALTPLGLAYLHVMWAACKGTLLVGGGFQKAAGNQTLANGGADAIVFGTAYIANPDLVKRLATDAALCAASLATFYTPGPKRYTHYPWLA